MNEKQISKALSYVRKKGWEKVDPAERSKRMSEIAKLRWAKKQPKIDESNEITFRDINKP